MKRSVTNILPIIMLRFGNRGLWPAECEIRDGHSPGLRGYGDALTGGV